MLQFNHPAGHISKWSGDWNKTAFAFWFDINKELNYLFLVTRVTFLFFLILTSLHIDESYCRNCICTYVTATKLTCGSIDIGINGLATLRVLRTDVTLYAFLELGFLVFLEVFVGAC